MAKTHSYTPVLGKRIRVTPLDTCGKFDKAQHKPVATSGFVSIKLAAEVEDGTEITVRKADGSLCVNEKQSNTFKFFTVELEFCGVNPSVLDIVTNATKYLDHAGDTAGFKVAYGKIEKKFALELWTGLSGQACAEGAEDASGYLLLPFITAGTIGDIEVNGEDAISFSMTGAVTKSGNAWGTGPYDVVKKAKQGGGGFDNAKLPAPLDPLDHLLMIDTALAPPPDSDQPVTVA